MDPATIDPGSSSRLVQNAFSAMGTTGEIIVPAPDIRAVGDAIERIEQLERRWSRFLPDSEISLLNSAAGAAVPVSDDTILLVESANEASRLTGGLFDPLLLQPLIDAGYDGDFASLPRDRPTPDAPNFDARSRARVERPLVDRVAGTVTVPHGAGFDPGGIGKGLAADLIGERLMRGGVRAGLVNLGGDLRVWGDGPHDGNWHVGLPDRTIALSDAGVATSGTSRRRWAVAGQWRHHLIDPSTGAPSAEQADWITVVASSAWLADAIAVAAAITPADEVPGMLAALGVEGVTPGLHTDTPPRVP